MLKKPWFAAILCVIVVLSSTVISVHRALDADCETTRHIFDAPDGIAEQLDKVCSAGSGIVKLAEKYGLDEFTTSDASDLCTSIRFAVGEAEPPELYDLYRILLTRVDELRTSLRMEDLSTEDQKLLDAYEADYVAAQQAIGNSGYNQSVNLYLRKLGGFSRFFARLCGVHLPEQFA